MLRFLDAGESHGKGIAVIIEGLPYGVPFSAERAEEELRRRRLGYGRGPRMALEKDKVEIMSGVRHGKTLGSPVCMLVRNAEWDKWKEVMDPDKRTYAYEPVTTPRPGHADLPGCIKYGTKDVRDILERASARETVGRVCAGALAKSLLEQFGIMIGSHVVRIGSVSAAKRELRDYREVELADDDPVRCLDKDVSHRMMREIDEANSSGDTLGGVFEVWAFGLPMGLGSHVHWDRRLDARLAMAVMSIQGIKGVEIGDGFSLSESRGSQSLDLFDEDEGSWTRRTNRSGGVEGGMSNGMPLVVRGAMKPIPTLRNGVQTRDLETGRKTVSLRERSDVCAVPAAAVVAESMVALVIADALMEIVGCDNLEAMRRRYDALLETRKELFPF
ncbi:MAG: chorismate synthase [Candidatus Geothermincolales bacterium]